MCPFTVDESLYIHVEDTLSFMHAAYTQRGGLADCAKELIQRIQAVLLRTEDSFSLLHTSYLTCSFGVYVRT